MSKFTGSKGQVKVDRNVVQLCRNIEFQEEEGTAYACAGKTGSVKINGSFQAYGCTDTPLPYQVNSYVDIDVREGENVEYSYKLKNCRITRISGYGADPQKANIKTIEFVSFEVKETIK